MTSSWLLLPGLAESPADFARLREHLPSLHVPDARHGPLRTLVPSGQRLLAGHSLGGLAALRVALERDDIAHLVLIDTTPPDAEPKPVRPWVRSVLGSAPVRAVARRIWTPVHRVGSRLMNRGHEAVPERPPDDGSGPRLAYEQDRQGEEDAAAVRRLLAAGRPLPPVTVVVGAAGSSRRHEEWRATQRRLADQLRPHASRVEVVELPDSGHLVHLDEPKELAAILRRISAR